MDKQTLLKRYDALLQKHGSQRALAEHIGVPRTTIQEWLKDRYTTKSPRAPLVIAPSAVVRRFIFTSAQDESAVHLGFWNNLKAYSKAMNAPIHIGGFTYNKRLFEETRKTMASFHPEIAAHLDNQQMQIGDNLIWCAEMNTLPTAATPLSGFEVYTGGKWGIFPHAKVQLISIPTMKGSPAKQLMTTGAVTLPNYVQRRAGIIANFHHVIGAVIVEILPDGTHFCRHLIAEDNGDFQDLTNYMRAGVLETGLRVEAIGWGDIHLEQMDWTVAENAWGIDATFNRIPHRKSMLSMLRPSFQFFHDTTDFTRRNHHNIKDPLFRYKQWFRGEECIQDSFHDVGDFLTATRRDDCLSVIVESNHDLAAKRWLKETLWTDDPVNARFHLEATLAALDAIEKGSGNFSVLGWALNRTHPDTMKDIVFLSEDESFQICGEIECSMHGHLGGNGAKGTPNQFTKMGPKANTGHTHSPGIRDGIVTGGASCNLDLGFNKGLSSWAHAHVLTYPNAKRTIVTMQNGKWRA